MRVLLIATNRHDRLQSRMNAQPMPIGLAYIAGHLDPYRPGAVYGYAQGQFACGWAS